MARSTNSHPWRSLGILGLLLLTIYGTVAAGVVWSDASWTPKLGLDLEGGVQIILTPQLQEGQTGEITQDTLNEAVNIIRQRVDSTGVAEAEITTQGNRNIVVALPGKPDESTRNLVKESAQLQFRAVIAEGAGTPTAEVTPTPTGTEDATGEESPTATPTESAAAEDGEASPTESANNASLPKAVREALAPKAADKTASPSPTTSADATEQDAASDDAGGDAAASPAATSPTDASDPAWATDEIIQEYTDLDCSDPANLVGGFTADPDKAMVACSQDGSAKYILGPAEVTGTDVKSASAVIGTTSQGYSNGQWEVNLEFTSEGGKKFADVTERLAAISQDDPRNQFGIVLDGLVISAPGTNERIPSGSARIFGSFTQQTATELANKLKFGALPLSFEVQTEEQISALLGKEQLERGLLAGLIGLILVCLYSLLQYRALGFVTMASLIVVGLVTYGVILLLSWRQGYRLSLPGVAGLIVSIGVTADSFIVYFERIRDEVRDGKQLLPAVETAWTRARRTILASDTVSFIAALVLYVLAVGGVKGFAFTLGLTTVVDVLVVFLFTKPTVTLLARTKFFGGGHKLSGFDAAHLGREVHYMGRGRVRPRKTAGDAPRGETIAERRARLAAEGTQDDPPSPDGPSPGGPSTGGSSTPQDTDVPASSGGQR